MRVVAFHPQAFEQYSNWAVEDAKLFERLRRLIVETARDPFGGIGRPEPLRGNLHGAWSRRVNDEHRLVYRVTNDQLIIMACRYHYDD